MVRISQWLGGEGHSSKCADSKGREQGAAREKDPTANKIKGQVLRVLSAGKEFQAFAPQCAFTSQLGKPLYVEDNLLKKQQIFRA